MNMDDNNYIEFEEAKPEKDNRRTILIIAGVVLLVCCCCIVGGYLFYQYLGDPLFEWLRSVLNF